MLLILFSQALLLHALPSSGWEGLVSESLERLTCKVRAWTEEGGRADDRGEERGDRLRGTWRDKQEMPVGLEPCCSSVAKTG